MNLNGKWYSETELEAYISELERLLRESQKVLNGAFFANHEYNIRANKLYNDISKLIGVDRHES